MRFEWDEAKNRANIRKHGLDFADAEIMFRNVLLVRADTREDYDEKRWIGIGQLEDGLPPSFLQNVASKLFGSFP